MLSSDDVIYLWLEGQFAKDCSLTEKASQWFSVDRQADRYFRRRLMAYTALASEGGLEEWRSSARGSLALALLLDRVSRACYRKTPMAFDADVKARRITRHAVDKGLDWSLSIIERIFLLFPFIASEKIDQQRIARNKLEAYSNSANNNEENILICNLISLVERNCLVLEKFSKFPHRSKILRRGMTQAEKEFVLAHPWQEWL